MSRLLCVSFVALLAAAPAAAQVPAVTSSISIDGLPAEIAANRTTITQDFTVTAGSEGPVCLTGSGAMDVQLTATVAGANGTNATGVVARFAEPTLTFSVSTQQSLQGWTQPQQATLVLEVPPVTDGVREVLVNVTATYAGGSIGCSRPLSGAMDTAATTVTFGRDERIPVDEDEDAVPGFGAAAALAGVALVALALRRRA